VRVSGDGKGAWSVEATPEEMANKPHYVANLGPYLTAYDGLFDAAQQKDEFQFILSLLAIRGIQGAGWDAFERTIGAIDATVRLHNETPDREAAAHLRLWIYGHIIEASEPYELVANLLDVADGGAFMVARFPDQNGRPQSPGAKLTWIEQRAGRGGHPVVAQTFRDRWDRELRNAIFHSDYALHGGEVRLVSGRASRTRKRWISRSR
jgi:hypothetical protein